MNTTFTPSSRLQPSKVSFPYKGGIYRFSPDQIIRLEADSNYTYIYLKNRKPILMAKVLSDYESVLEPFGFIRTHRSHMVNRQHIADVQTHQVVMDDQSKAEISRRKRKGVFQLLIKPIQAA